MDWVRKLQNPNYWLLALAAAIATLHLVLLDQDGDQNLLSLSILFWLAIASMLWEKRHQLKLQSGAFSTLIGIVLISIVLLRSISPAGYHVRLSPFLCGLALCLMASGVKQLYQYWKELLILGLLVLHSVFVAILSVINIPILTSQFASFVLWITGFDVHREGIIIALPTGKVEVLNTCAGPEILILMFNTAVIFLLLFPQKNLDKLICLILAPLIGFFTNGLRVYLMTLLVAYSDKKTFEYWHGEDGSLIFSMISVLLFGLFCWFFYIRKGNDDLETEALLQEPLHIEKKYDQ